MAPRCEEAKLILATDVGSTTTKARLFNKLGNEYRFICTGEAPTTVETPFEDVTIGVRNAVTEIERKMDIKILTDAGIQIRDSEEGNGVDLYVTTSSAGGGLQMMCFGVTKSITAESAERAALGAGAIIMDVVTVDDGEPIFKKVEKTRFLRPDMVLLAGGTDGGAVARVAQAIEILSVAEPRARFGDKFSLPVVYAGNLEAREIVKDTFNKKFALEIVDNIRPTVELERTDPARNAIHKLFMQHVMSHAPGYDELMKWTDVPIMPTPMGEGQMFQTIAKIQDINVIGVGLGGATTNIYSIFDEKFVRTVSANLGMSYSICNVLKQAKAENIMRWLPFDLDEKDLVDILTNKMIRPTTIPQTLDELMIEHATARESIRLAFNHHLFLARPLRGIIPIHEVSKILEITVSGLETYIDMMKIDLIGGTGGLLSHAPKRVQSMMILMDAFQPEGVTKLVQDSVFMMPHLGVLSTVHPQAAMEILEKDCLVHLGTCIAPKNPLEEEKNDETILKMELKMPDGDVLNESFSLGDLKRFPLPLGEEADVSLIPNKKYDVGAGRGHALVTKVQGGEVGVIVDARGRPLKLPTNIDDMKSCLNRWFKEIDMYPV
jgi:uncharacterized protein (TIGR01319 family)